MVCGFRLDIREKMEKEEKKKRREFDGFSSLVFDLFF
jgi:hypothetical protein